MDLHDFANICDILPARGFIVRTAEYWDHAFGSWVIEFSANRVRPHRLVWDGKDRLLTLQCERPEKERTASVSSEVLQQMNYVDGVMLQVRQKEEAWKDAWIGREKTDQSLDRALEQIENG